LRVFDIRDPHHPREIAYFNQPSTLTPHFGEVPVLSDLATNAIPPSWAQSSPAFVPERCEIWYSDGRTGFYNVRLTNGTCDVMRGTGAEAAGDRSDPTPLARADTKPTTSPKPTVPAPAPSRAGDATVDPATDKSRICVLSICL
jgi:hypothetical protein